MAKKKISDLPAGSALTGVELLPIVQSGTTKKITAQDIANLGNASGVEGSGTINYLSKFTASSTIGNSQLFDNGTAIGIGTITPLGILHLYKSAATTRMVMDGDAGQSKIITYRSGGLQRFGLYVNNTPESGSNVGSDFQIRAYSDAGTLLSTPLFIKRSTGAATFASSVGIGAVQSGVSFNINYNSGANDAIRLSNSASGGANWFIGDGTGSGGAAGTFAIAGGATTTPKFSIASSGSATFSSSVTANGNVSSYGQLRLETSAYGSIVVGSRSSETDFQIYNTGNIFRIYNGSTDAFNINTSGNVGIGTNTPARTLSVNGQIGLSDDLISTNSTNVARFGYNAYYASSGFNLTTENSIALTFGTASTERMRIFSDGNIAINSTTNAGYKLDVNGTARVKTTSGNGLVIETDDVTTLKIISGGTKNWGFAKSNLAANDFGIYQSTSTGGDPISAGTAKLYFNGSGAATFSSSVQATQGKFYGARPQVIITENNTGGLYLRDATSTSYKSWSIGTNDIVLGFAITASTTNGGSTFTEPLFNIKENGQIAIGTTTPDASAKVQIDSTTQGFLVPRMGEDEINGISSPAEGLMVYNTDQKHMCMYDGSGWKKFSMSNM